MRMVKTVLFRAFHRTKYINTSKALEQCPTFAMHSINIIKRIKEVDTGRAEHSKTGCVLRNYRRHMHIHVNGTFQSCAA